MTLRFMEGFEVENHLTHAQRKYATVTGGWGTAVAGRTNSVHRAISDPDMILVTPALVGAVTNSWTIGFGYQMADASSAPGSVTRAPGIRLLDGPSETADEQVSIEFQPAVVLSSEVARVNIVIRRGATVLATGATNLLQKRWYYVEFQVTVHPSTGTYQVKVYDQVHGTVVTELNDTGQNTANQGTAGADRVAIVWDSVGTTADNVIFDDIYVADDSTYRASKGFVIEGLETSAGNGDVAQWDLQGGATDVGDALKDEQSNAQAAFEDQRISSDTIGQVSLAPYADLGWIKDGTIAGVMCLTVLRMESSGTRTIAPVFRHKNPGPTSFTGTGVVISDTNFDTIFEVFPTNPVTTIAWLVADVNLGQWGVEVTA